MENKMDNGTIQSDQIICIALINTVQKTSKL